MNMNENKNHGEDREHTNQTGSMENGNTNQIGSEQHRGDNSGMHAGGSTGSAYRSEGSEGSSQSQGGSHYGSETYKPETGYQPGPQSGPHGSVGSRMNEQHLNEHQQSGQGGEQYRRPEEQQYGQSGRHEQYGQSGQQGQQGMQGQQEHKYGREDDTIGHDRQSSFGMDQNEGRKPCGEHGQDEQSGQDKQKQGCCGQQNYGQQTQSYGQSGQEEECGKESVYGGSENR